MSDYPPKDHPTSEPCRAMRATRSGAPLPCPAYLNHDGEGGAYCPDDGHHLDTREAIFALVAAADAREARIGAWYVTRNELLDIAKSVNDA